MIQVEIPYYEMNKLNQAIKDVSKTSRQGIKSLTAQSARFFVQSVIKLTGPTPSSLKSAAKKFKYRPLVSAKRTGVKGYIRKDGSLYRPRKDDPENGFYYETHKGFVFRTEARLQHKKREARGRKPVTPLKKVEKAIKFWDKKKGTWGFIPYPKRSLDMKHKFVKIPHALAAKGGWMGVLRLLNKTKGELIPKIGTKYSRYIFRTTKDEAMAEMVNQIKYTHKKWPTAVPEALKKVTNRIRGREAKRIKRKMKQAWEKQGLMLK